MVRVSIYAEYISTKGIEFTIPNWNKGQLFFVPWMQIPVDLHQYLHPGFRCFVDVDIAADSIVNLAIENWRLYDFTL